MWYYQSPFASLLFPSFPLLLHPPNIFLQRMQQYFAGGFSYGIFCNLCSLKHTYLEKMQ